MAKSPTNPTPLNFVMLAKPGNTFLFRLDGRTSSINAAMRQLTEFANDPELAFDWSDAATVARKLKEQHG